MTNSIYIRIDYREIKLYNALTALLSENIKCENLEIGDIEITYDNLDIKFIFERKTQGDLLSSITDGRYREQKIRMLGQCPSHRCTYIIEGADIADEVDWLFPKISPTVYEGAILHTMYRDKMHIVYTKDILHTAKWLTIFYKKFQAHPEKFIDSAESYISQIKTKSKKCENIDKETCFILQLCQVPGISIKIAKEIAQKYSNLKDLIHAFDNCDTIEKKRQLLANINMVGPKKAEALIEYLQL